MAPGKLAFLFNYWGPTSWKFWLGSGCSASSPKEIALDYMTTDQRRERREKNSKRGLNKKD